MLRGFAPPLTPSGRSSLVSAPPWHYAGWVASAEYELDPRVASTFLPSGFGEATGRATFHAVEWQATTDGGELLDPAYAQYKECLVVLEALRDREAVNYLPLIWVDQDIAMVRGMLQGIPKKLASVWLTRSYDLDHPAAAPLRSGTRLGATLAVKDRRIADLRLTLTGEPGSRLGLLARPTFGLLLAPTVVVGEEAPAPRLVRMSAVATYGPSHRAVAELDYHESPHEDLASLMPRRVVDAAVGTLALTIDGVVAVDR
jgi:hypothetical protein